MSVLIVGCGYLGMRAAKAWLAAGRKVYALTRSRADELRANGIEPIVGDVLNPESLKGLPQTDTVLYAVGMDRSAGRSMQEVYVQGLGNVLGALGSETSPPVPLSMHGEGVFNSPGALSSPRVCERAHDCRSQTRGDDKSDAFLLNTPSPCMERGTGGEVFPKFLYISSTSVYGQTDGSWIDETSPAEPLEESGRVILEAEQLLQRFRPDAVILRFAGIYGPGRVLRKASLLKGEPVPGNGERFVNLIHVDDGVRAVLAAEANATSGETYLIADEAPPTRRELFTRTAELIGAPVPTFVGDGGVEANRRVSNAKAKRRLGFQPLFPSITTGLEFTLNTSSTQQ